MIIVLWVVVHLRLDLLICRFELSSVNLNGIIGLVLDSGLHFDLFDAFKLRLVACILFLYIVCVF